VFRFLPSVDSLFRSRPIFPSRLRRDSRDGERGKQGLRRMASETGGTYFEVTNSQSLEDIYLQIEEALGNQYSIGYTPGRSEPDGKYHKIKLTTKDHHLIVNTRAGYNAK